MPVVTAFPPGQKPDSFVRNNPEKQLCCPSPPIQFCPSPLPKARNDADKTTIKISFPSNVSKTFKVFFGGNLEQAINHSELVLSILEDKHTKQKILRAELALTQKEESLRRIRECLARAPAATPASHVRFTNEVSPEEPTRNASRVSLPERATEADVEALESAVLELKGEIDARNQSIFDTFEQSLAPPLQVQFRIIVAEQCDSDDYVTLQGTRATEARGRFFDSFKPVAIAWLRQFGPEDAAEITLRLMQNHVLMNTDCISVEAGVHRMRQLNRLLPWCPSLKHTENAPAAVPEPKELSEFEMCTVILASTMSHVRIVFNAIQGRKFTTSLDELTILLKRADAQVRSNRQLLNAATKVANGGRGSGRDNQNRTGGGGGRIPRRDRNATAGTNREPGEINAHTSGKKKECSRCAEHNPRAKNTHWTSECMAFEANGTRKARRGNGEDTRGGDRKNKRYNNAIQELGELKKKYKKQKKKHKKAQKKRRRSGGSSYSSSDSSDSDSS